MMRTKIAASAVGLALLAPAAAQAHISLHPNTVPAGAFATIDVRMPGEQEGAHVISLALKFPPGFSGVDYATVPGWSAKLSEEKLAKPVEEGGEKVESQVSEIVWTWTGPLDRVDNGQFIDLPLSVAVPKEDAGRSLEFRAVQTYSNGQVVHWIEPSLEAEHPAPRINVTAKGGVVEEIAGDEAGPAAGQAAGSSVVGAAAPATVKPSGGASKGLAIAALVVGALGLLAGIAALTVRRRGAV